MSMILKTEKVIKEWTDYNGHMNMSYYVLIFDNAAEVMLTRFKMGGDSAKSDKKSTRHYMNFLQYADGKNDLKKISELIKMSYKKTLKIYNILTKYKLIT